MCILKFSCRSTKHKRESIRYLFAHYMGKENWIPLMMRGFKFFAISAKRKMKISRQQKLNVSMEVICHLAKTF